MKNIRNDVLLKVNFIINSLDEPKDECSDPELGEIKQALQSAKFLLAAQTWNLMELLFQYVH